MSRKLYIYHQCKNLIGIDKPELNTALRDLIQITEVVLRNLQNNFNKKYTCIENIDCFLLHVAILSNPQSLGGQMMY